MEFVAQIICVQCQPGQSFRTDKSLLSHVKWLFPQHNFFFCASLDVLRDCRRPSLVASLRESGRQR